MGTLVGRIPGHWRWSELALEAKYNENALGVLCHRSTRQLRRQSQRYVGMTLHGSLDELRFVEARQRLLSGVKPKEFANDLGFNHARDFHRYFKRHAGITPVEFVALINQSSGLAILGDGSSNQLAHKGYSPSYSQKCPLMRVNTKI